MSAGELFGRRLRKALRLEGAAIAFDPFRVYLLQIVRITQIDDPLPTVAGLHFDDQIFLNCPAPSSPCISNCRWDCIEASAGIPLQNKNDNTAARPIPYSQGLNTNVAFWKSLTNAGTISSTQIATALDRMSREERNVVLIAPFQHGARSACEQLQCNRLHERRFTMTCGSDAVRKSEGFSTRAHPFHEVLLPRPWPSAELTKAMEIMATARLRIEVEPFFCLCGVPQKIS
jgi:hypothetical protein